MIENMPRPRPPHLHRETTRHGKHAWYVRIGKGKRVRIDGDYGSPEFTADAGASYPIELPIGHLTFSADFYHTSKYYFDPAAQYAQGRYNVLGLRAAWTDPSDHYTVALYGNNVTDARYRTSYLATNFGPTAAPAAAVIKVTLPGGPGKELVETRCTACHDLERVATIKRQKADWPVLVANMVGRGAVATPEEAQTITSYLAAHFGGE